MRTILNHISYYIILVFSITIVYFLNDEQLNYFQVVFLVLCSCLYFFEIKLYRDDFRWIALVILMMISIEYSGVFKVTSFIYTLSFIYTFALYKFCAINGKVNLVSISKLIKYIIYAYFFVQIIQQISSLANIPPLNGEQFYIADNRFNSLSNEPSHTARIVPILMLTYMYLRKFTTGKKYVFKDIKNDKLLWFTYLYVILTSGSSLGFMTVLFPFLCFISMRKILIYSLSGGLVVGLCITYIKNPAFDRIKNLLPILLSLDPDMIRMIDNSGAARINPYIYYFQDLNFLDLKYWFGFGRGYSEPMLIERVLGHKTDFSSGAGGLFPVMFYDYGLIAGLATIYAIGKTTFTKNNKVFIIFWILFISSGDLNSYYQWLYICLGYTCKNAKMFKINNNA